MKHVISVATVAAVTALGAASAGASWTVTNLHPAGATSSSAWAASGNQQAGRASVDGVQHASLWSGTAASWVDLNPAGATESVAWAASGNQQAGRASVGGTWRASLWSGTAESWVDLHSLLSEEFSYSQAYGISTDGINLYVVGHGWNTIMNREEALLWTQPIPTPGAAALLGLGALVASRRRRTAVM